MEQLNHKVEDPELDLKSLIDVLRRNRKTIFKFTGSFFLLALIYALFFPRTYQAITTVKLPDSNESSANAIREMAFLPTSGDPVETYMEVADADKVAAGVVDALQLRSKSEFKDMTDLRLVWYLKSQVKVDNVKNSDIISIHAKAKTGQDAADLANAWAQSFIKVNLDLSRQGEEERYQFIHGQLQAIRDKLAAERESKQNLLDPTNEVETDEEVYKSLLEQDQETKIQANNQNTGIVVVDPAAVSDKPVSPKTLLSIILGLLVGFVFGVVVSFVRDRTEDLVYGEAELNRAIGAPLWAEIPLAGDGIDFFIPPTELLITKSASQYSAYLRGIKTLRTRLFLARSQTDPQAFGILSAVKGEGKSLVGANLALSLAQSGKKVLLVDADLGNPRIGQIFGVETSEVSGLSRLLSGQVKLMDVVRPSGTDNLMILPSPVIHADPAELLGSSRFKKVVEDMKQKFDFILFDMTALLDSVDSIVLTNALDGVIFLARYGKTRRIEIQKAFQQLRAAHISIWGTVINGVKVEKGPRWDILGFYDIINSKYFQKLPWKSKAVGR